MAQKNLSKSKILKQKICKIVVRKLAIFSFSLIFTENRFSMILKVSTEQLIFNTKKI